jgi:hypothetical protein
MPVVFKVWDGPRALKRTVVASSFEELLGKGTFPHIGVQIYVSDHVYCLVQRRRISGHMTFLCFSLQGETNSV